MSRRGVGWLGALSVLAITAVLVVLDISDGPVHRFWARHSFTASVLSGVLVLLFTVLIVDRVAHGREVRNQSRAVAAQASIIAGQATRTVDAVKRPSQSDEQKDQAGDEMRTYMEILLTSAPVLINADRPRAFLESAQRLAALLVQAMRDDKDEHATAERLDCSLRELRDAEAPLLDALSPQQRAAVSSVTADPSDG
jgi:hypothetical protein